MTFKHCLTAGLTALLLSACGPKMGDKFIEDCVNLVEQDEYLEMSEAKMTESCSCAFTALKENVSQQDLNAIVDIFAQASDPEDMVERMDERFSEERLDRLNELVKPCEL